MPRSLLLNIRDDSPVYHIKSFHENSRLYLLRYNCRSPKSKAPFVDIHRLHAPSKCNARLLCNASQQLLPQTPNAHFKSKCRNPQVPSFAEVSTLLSSGAGSSLSNRSLLLSNLFCFSRSNSPRISSFSNGILYVVSGLGQKSGTEKRFSRLVPK